jgi:hypothetical protein
VKKRSSSRQLSLRDFFHSFSGLVHHPVLLDTESNPENQFAFQEEVFLP